MKFTSDVPSNVYPGTNIVDYLALRFTYHTREKWCTIVQNGSIQIDANQANLNDCVNPGSKLLYDAGDFEEPAANLDYHIVFEDEWFIGIDKPGNLLVHRAGKSFKNNLIYQLRNVHTPPFVSAHTIHRLDRDTSGVVLIAKNTTALAAMSAQFAQQLVCKEYYAIVHGIPSASQKVVNAPIGKSDTSEVRYKFMVSSDGKSAVTEIVEVTPIGDRFSLVRVMPATGRTHQIRIHLSHISHTIVGDKLYGMSESAYLLWRDNPHNEPHGLLFHRHALHCGKITFTHPFTNKSCSVEAALPEDMKKLIDQIRSNKNIA